MYTCVNVRLLTDGVIAADIHFICYSSGDLSGTGSSSGSSSGDRCRCDCNMVNNVKS